MCTTVGRRLLDGVLPPLCLGCGEIVETPGALCAMCWPDFSFIAPPHCERCGTPLEEDLGAGAWCAACLARPPRFAQARAVFVYDEKSRRLVLPLKHGDRTDLARSCGLWMARAGAELLAGADIVVPVPLHWRRLFTRRYNQALLLARNVVRATPATVSLAPDLLVRRRWTGSQAGLAARERRHNVREAFAVHPRWAGRLKGKAVVLVDDVLTTGATADACVRALQRGGARRVDVLTLARVVRPAL
ncbi:MAG: ComF family protein [Proteobacteria bacterium]|nr:ComF family protein [Pseudomonadota bacterium]